jgi:purine-nucleoside/S-methyl-5'-thioadenosine phosphorylase / adenosine deaminase
VEWRERDGVRWLQADLGEATAAFTTRLGGVSEPPFESLNLGLLTDDDADAVGENRRRVGEALGFGSDRFAFGRQVHGAELAIAGDIQAPDFFPPPQGGPRRAGTVPEVDGQVVSEPGTASLIFAADCLPVALHGPGGVAMLHCGWRGLAAGIIARGAEAVGAKAAAIGPGIGPCCYGVGEEVLAAFDGLGTDVATNARLDLPEVARRLLATAGVEDVESAGLCTSCEAELFFSHRRDGGRTGRQAGVAWLDPGGR